MSWSKIIAVTTVFLFILGIAIIDCAVAGEKMKWHGTSTTIEMKKIEVGDEEGHVMAITKAKQLYINEKTGERTTGISVNTMNINPKMKQVSLQLFDLA